MARLIQPPPEKEDELLKGFGAMSQALMAGMSSRDGSNSGLFNKKNVPASTAEGNPLKKGQARAVDVTASSPNRGKPPSMGNAQLSMGRPEGLSSPVSPQLPLPGMMFPFTLL